MHEGSDLFVYCGHGAGEKMCDSYKMRRWTCPNGLLWGCSSGQLAVQGVHDPIGAALNYLMGGATFVVGNLWDVTDKDIDKLSMESMRLYFDCIHINGKGTSDAAAENVQS
jgi:separase